MILMKETDEGEKNEESPATKDSKPDKKDCVNNYHVARLSFGLIMMLFTDSVKEGDSKRLMICLKIALLILHSHQRVKYSYVLLLFLAKVHIIKWHGFRSVT